jgi:hypothetical protein
VFLVHAHGGQFLCLFLLNEWDFRIAIGYSGEARATLRVPASKQGRWRAFIQVIFSRLTITLALTNPPELLSKPLSKTQPATRTAPEPPPPESLPMTTQEETLAKARIVFGSKLAGPAERRKEIEAASQKIAGVIVPPRPEEPDNCCMSGCVNCVWDLYRDEMEEWAAKSAEARARIQAQREEGKGTGTMLAGKGTPSHVATSMDDDGGGSEANWGPTDTEGSLFDDIPVGIREFMKTEKRLKQKNAASA